MIRKNWRRKIYHTHFYRCGLYLRRFLRGIKYESFLLQRTQHAAPNHGSSTNACRTTRKKSIDALLWIIANRLNEFVQKNTYTMHMNRGRGGKWASVWHNLGLIIKTLEVESERQFCDFRRVIKNKIYRHAMPFDLTLYARHVASIIKESTRVTEKK